jgi:EVE domain
MLAHHASLHPARPPQYSLRMAHYVFNFSSGDRERATALLRAKMWGIGGDERHRDALAPGDLALIYVATPERAFIGRVELATAVHDWTPSEANAYRDDSPSGVVLSHVEEWDPPVPMDTAVQRIDPTASNPLVQANAAAGFRMGVVRITGDEYEAALALRREARAT